jgi:hypothetical protein
MRYSVLIVRAKAPFWEWIEEMSKTDILKRAPKNMYFSEESPAWLIRSMGSFDSQEDLDNYIESLKPSLLRREIRPISKDFSNFEPGGADIFDIYFDLDIRDEVVDIKELVK